MKLAIIGATGLVGRKLLEIIEEKSLSFDKIITAASPKSKGTIINISNKKYKIVTLQEALNFKPDIAIFSAGSKVSQEWAPIFAKKNIFVIDNSSQWRMDPNIKLIVPEINGNLITNEDKIIANPNCSTIQLVMALKPIYDNFKIKRIVISTYQAVSGSGKKALDQLDYERKNKFDSNKYYPHKIDLNLIPHIDNFLDNGYSKEELKIINETKKILDDHNIKITATAVRVPIANCHSLSVNLELQEEFNLSEIRDLLKNTEGLKVVDDPFKNEYPMPIDANNCDLVRIGRIRKDLDHPKALNMWVVADNIRKGAATNALEIIKYINDLKTIKI
ncbi:MAG: aspartate-semialdehyde dehydrogenase [Bacteroidetes bacterium]|nr:aspartate-semialdehyde dehydrogenase [Bacteroidota bacterium]